MKRFIIFNMMLFSFLFPEAELLSAGIPAGIRDFAVLRVEFAEDSYSGTTGNGRFMLEAWTGHDTTYVLDPIPHDRAYFEAHLKFLDHYWRSASADRIAINTDQRFLLPPSDTAVYTLPRQMRYYTQPDSLDSRLAELVYESVHALYNAGDAIPENDGLIIFHAGVGQDFNIPLDDSPFDIPSFYFDEDYLAEYLTAGELTYLSEKNAVRGIVLPETQNQLKVNIALNGTEVLLSGMLLGLPPLYNTENGRSGAGIFGLMDQGSNNADGLCPVRPSAFERYLLGAEQPQVLEQSGIQTLTAGGSYRIPISSNEYFLLEYRKNTGIWADSLYWSDSTLQNYHDVLQTMKTLGYIDYTLENGVLTSVSNYDLGLPASGLLIWHVSEPDEIGANPNGGEVPLLDLVEADGGDDIGKMYNTLDPSVNNGWKWDMWFNNNPAWSDNNPNAYRMQFNDASNPDSRSAAGLSSGIAIRRFDFYKDSVHIYLEINQNGRKIFPGLVFDEMSTAIPAYYSSPKSLVGFRDSSLLLYNAYTLKEIYREDKPYKKEKTVLLSNDRNLIQIVNGDHNAEIKYLSYGLDMLGVLNTVNIPHTLDLEHIALNNDTLYFSAQPEDGTETSVLYKLELTGWNLDSLQRGSPYNIPCIADGRILFASAETAAIMNGMMIGAESSGGYSYDGEDIYAAGRQFRQIIPLHLDESGAFCILALTDEGGRRSLAAFNHYGYLLDHFPVYEDYRDIRVYYHDGEPLILAYDPAGIIDVYSKTAAKQYSLPAPANASTLFIEQISPDTAWIVADGSIYPVASDSVYWGYRGKDAVYTNTHRAQGAPVPIGTEALIRDGLIYNYPNPAEGDVTRFRFFAGSATSLTISIYQLSGRFVETLNAGTIHSGQWNEVEWDVSGMQSGVYLARIEIRGPNNRQESYMIKPAILK